MSAAPGTNGLGQLQQGFIERSNVDLEVELAELRIISTRVQLAAIKLLLATKAK